MSSEEGKNEDDQARIDNEIIQVGTSNMKDIEPTSKSALLKKQESSSEVSKSKKGGKKSSRKNKNKTCTRIRTRSRTRTKRKVQKY